MLFNEFIEFQYVEFKRAIRATVIVCTLRIIIMYIVDVHIVVLAIGIPSSSNVTESHNFKAPTCSLQSSLAIVFSENFSACKAPVYKCDCLLVEHLNSLHTHKQSERD